MTCKERKRAREKARRELPEVRAAIAQRNKELSEAIKGQGPDESLFRHGVRHKFGVHAVAPSGYMHNGRMVWA